MDLKESKLLLIKYEALKLLHAVYDQYQQVSYNELFESVSSIDIDKEYGNSKKTGLMHILVRIEKGKRYCC